MAPNILIQLFVSGLIIGSVYALIALGFIAIYRGSNILNLAQGDFVVLGGLATAFFLKTCRLPYPVAAVAAVALVAAVGCIIYLGVIRPLKNKSVLILIMVTIGISILLSGTSGLIFGTAPQSLPPVVDLAPIKLGEVIRIPYQGLFVMGATVLVLASLYLVSRFTFTGRAMEAVATDRLGADLVGISRSTILMLSFAVSGAVGAIAGIFVTPLFFTHYSAGGLLGMKGFAAAVVGGWGRYRGAVIGGLVLGVTESMSVAWMPSGYKDAVAFTLMLAILYFRPKGLLGSRALEEARK